MLRQNWSKALVWLFVLLGGSGAYAQVTHTFPAEDTNNAFTGTNSFAHVNSTLYVGAVSGQFVNIQAGVTTGCAGSTKVIVDIPAGSSPTDSPTTITGCANVGIVDERALPFAYYAWNGTIYVGVSSGGGGGGVYTGSASIATSGTPAVNTVCIGTSSAACTFSQLTADQILPGFTINSFSCASGATVEIGASVVNPGCTATYSTTPGSAQITNTDAVGSPLVLATPFTSGAFTGTFTHTTSAIVTFNLTAVGGSTKTASSALNWLPRVFAGVGASGATSATASGTFAILNSSFGTLTNAGLSSSQVGNVYTGLSPSSQKVYLLLIGGFHTFKDNTTGFAFAFNSPTSITFVNANGSSVTMFLYESTNTLTGTFNILVAS